jgi:hypothetical protein
MQDTDVPAKFNIPWGNSAGPSYIRVVPQASQIGVQAGAASLTDGYPPLTFTPEASGGVPPFGQDTNGILNQITAWLRWLAGGGDPPVYDSTFQSAIGGYRKGAVVSSATTFGHYWMSLVDNNTSNPDTGGANWAAWGPGATEYVVDTGAANALVVTPQTALTAYVNGVEFLVDPAHANTGAATINVSGLGAVPIVHVDGTALIAGEIQVNQLVRVAYFGSSFQYLNAPYALTQSPLNNSTKPASTAYVDAAVTSQDNFAGNLVGLITSNTPSFTTTRITVATGMCRDSTNAINLSLAAPISKSITAAWSAGTGNGGRDSAWASLSNGQTGYTFLIFNPTTVAYDVLFSQSPTSPSLPAGYTYFRRVNSFLLESASTNLKQFIQVGDWFEFVVRSTDYANTSNGGLVSYLRSISVPIGVKCKAKIYFQSNGTIDNNPYLSGVYDPDLGTPPAFGVGTQWAQVRRTAASTPGGTQYAYGTVVLEQWTDNSGHIYTASSDTADVIALGVLAYQDITLNRYF